jgi:hypothetical protein
MLFLTLFLVVRRMSQLVHRGRIKQCNSGAPGRPIAASMAGPNLLAHVLVAKFDAQLLLIANTESSPEWARTFPKAS